MFDARKATHMAAYLLSKAGTAGLERIKLMKLMYISDRIALQEDGFSISGDTYASMKNGPVLMGAYKQLMKKGAPDPESDWMRLIAREKIEAAAGDDVLFKLVQPVGIDDIGRLSPLDCEKMDQAWEEYGGQDTEALVQITHEFDEWERPSDPPGHKDITLESIFRAVGHSEEMVRELLKAAAEQEELDAFLASMAA